MSRDGEIENAYDSYSKHQKIKQEREREAGIIRRYMWLILFTVFIVLLSVYTIGYVLNIQSSKKNMVLNTIFINKPSDGSEASGINVSGNVFTEDRKPVNGAYIAIEGSGIASKTDMDGSFFLSKLEYGTYTLKIFDDTGSLIAYRDILIRRHEMVSVAAVGTDDSGRLVIDLSENVSGIDIIVIVKGDGEAIEIEMHSFEVKEETQTRSTDTVSAEEQNRFTGYPQPSLTNERTTGDCPPELSGTEEEHSQSVQSDTMASETGETSRTSRESMHSTDENVSSALEASGTSASYHNGAGDTASTNPSQPNSGSIGVLENNKEWSQLGNIGIFGRGTVLSPGMQGEYDFKVVNSNDFAVKFTMLISEDEHEAGKIPLCYRLRRGNTYLAGSAEADGWISGEILKDIDIQLGAGSEILYTLEWSWVYDGGNDELDTMIGEAVERMHQFDVTLFVEQI